MTVTTDRARSAVWTADRRQVRALRDPALRDPDIGPVTVACARCPERPFIASAVRLDVTRPAEVRSQTLYLCQRCATAMWYTPALRSHLGRVR